MDFDTEEAEFAHEEVEGIVKQVIDKELKAVTFNAKKTQDHCAAVIDACIKDLLALGKPFKYAVTCIIMQKTGAGLHTAATCFWDNKTDGFVRVPWENNTMHCIVTVFGMAIFPSPQPGEESL